MNMRRNTGRGRRVQSLVSASGEVVDLSGAWAQYDMQAAHVTKGGTDLISQVSDQSGNARHLTQGTDANKLLWVSAALNGQDVARANDTTLRRELKTGLGASAETELTIAVVWKVTTPNSSGNMIRPLEHLSGTGTNGYAIGSFSTTNTRRMQFIDASHVTTAASFGDMPTGTWEKWVFRCSAPSSNTACDYQDARVDGASLAITGTLTFQAAIAASNLVLMGKTAAAATNYELAALRVWRRKLNDVSVLSLEDQWLATYGI
jgi:hypothetical protein